MRTSNSGSAPAPGLRYAYRSGFVLAAVFIGTLGAVQFAKNGSHGLADQQFIGLELGVGLLAFRAGYVLARAYARLARVARGRGAQPK